MAATKQMSPVDSAWLRMEDPTNLMMVTGIALLDRPVDFDRFRKTLEARLLTLDRFTMRVVETRLPVGTPHWEEDPTFNLDAHIHRVALPAPGGMAELQAFVSDLASTPMDFSKPLWHMHLVENVLGDKTALVLRFHHCIGDGTAMTAVMYRLMDAEPDAPVDEVKTETETESERRSLVGTMFTPVRAVVSLPGKAIRLTGRTASVIARESVNTLRHPTRIVKGTENATEVATIIGRVLLMPPDPETPFKGTLGVQKRVAWSDVVDLMEVKDIGKKFGTKVNDVLLSAVTGALRRYLIEQDVDVADLEIRVVVPVDLRPPERALELGNNFGLVFVSLPLHIADPVERLLETKRRMDVIKQSLEAVAFFGMLNIFGVAPPQVEDQVVNIFATRATAVMTNVIGPRQPLYLAGAKIENMMFWVPQSGRLGMGISVLSYADQVTLGVIADAGLVADPERITGEFIQEFSKLLALAAAKEEKEQS